MHPLGKVKVDWSPSFAYAIGLLVTDGCLYGDGRHINFTSKDHELVEMFRRCLRVDNKIGRKSRGGESEKRYFQIQIGDRLFHQYLGAIGITPKKSKTIQAVKMPERFFFDFLRGCIDGDGTIVTNSHPESIHRQLKTRLFSASRPFLVWIFSRVRSLAPEILGGSVMKSKRIHVLSFGKKDSIALFHRLYYPIPEHFLRRKYDRAVKWMGE